MIDDRPDPDALLRSVQAEAAKQDRGRLKIFFGMAPGVGKTFAMLESARRLREQDIDVVIGWVETHGRADTAALVNGLEMIPAQSIEYRGHAMKEMALDQALARKPEVLLVDELAHTNVPGARHAKRWQDVLDVLDAGIDVFTTLNVQHVESLNDVVHRITGVRVRETVPDHILDRADEIELVDLPPDELLVRLSEGKVYVPEQAQRASQNFFERGNLLALRELALRRTADRVEADVHAYRAEHGVRDRWETHERLLVCVSADPSSAEVIRRARRLAEKLPATWVAVHVEAGDRAPLSDEARARVNAHLRLAESLGAEVEWLTGPRVVDALLDHVRTHHVTRVVMGQALRLRRFGPVRRLLGWVSGSLADDLIRKSRGVEIDIVPIEAADDSPPQVIRPPVSPIELGLVTLMVAIVTTIGWVGRDALDVPDVVMIYVLGIVLSAMRFGTVPSLVASGLSVLAYDFFFVPPTLAFDVSDARHLLSFATMFSVGAVISTLAGRVRQQTRAERAREAETRALYQLVRQLALAGDPLAVARAAVAQVDETFGAKSAILVRNDDGLATLAGDPIDTQEIGVATWSLDHLRAAGIGADALPGATVAAFPLSAGAAVLGVLVLRPKLRPSLQEIDRRHFVDLFTRQIGLALSRAQASEDLRQASLRAKTEELRSSLLSSVSHDLRTPLASITGAATTLRATPQSAETKTELLESIIGEASRMERLVGNLLDMTRLEGGLEPVREWVPLSEVVGGALTRLEPMLGGRTITVQLPSDLPLLHIDPVLFQQVIVNLIENAVAYTPTTSPIDIDARINVGKVDVRVSDRGPGLPVGEEERIFERFQRGSRRDGRGVGLGLAICRGIMQAHGGTIRALQRSGGGAVFVLTLPVETPPAVEAA